MINIVMISLVYSFLVATQITKSYVPHVGLFGLIFGWFREVISKYMSKKKKKLFYKR